MHDIPASVRQKILPHPSLNPFSLVRFPAPIPLPESSYEAHQYLSTHVPTNDKIRDIFLLTPPPSALVHELRKLLNSDPSICSVVLPHDEVDPDERYPLWVVQFWVELIPFYVAQKKWCTAVASIERRQRHRTKLSGGSSPSVDATYVGVVPAA
ncbi:hypothetical protein K435DRAFT_860973 [Dendrothele bispora CBS 962.96]|uniref:Uncharacterized protein n=1 Tax=Dendrothele bispora (strain CBS 962.96) TaxID=1314807 RepID=A0A4S8LWG5_DENBC|nr:hypothetical protein K435DRAFT_871490 [Dendrothele bispora CBS 962.96]THU93974.1 hypothetical protein K435DRAFT_860973 [Dendrothele bispora CBS 962.96]